MVLKIHDLKVINLNKFPDERGFFVELFKGENNWKQVNCSVSKKNVLRGLHVVPFKKLVTCIFGKIFDVVVDARKDSKTYLAVDTIILENAQTSVLIPEHCAHGFMALEDNSILLYMQSGEYNPKEEKSLLWNDETLNIPWEKAEYIISDKDKKASTL